MSGRVSRASVIGAILRKDFQAYTRDRLWIFLTAFGLIMFAVVFWVLPDSVNETITVGVYPADLAKSLERLGESEDGQGEAAAAGLEVVSFDSVSELEAVVSGETEAEGARGDISIGLAFPEDFTQGIADGRRVQVTVFVDSGVPAEVRDAMSSAVREIAYLLSAAASGEDLALAVPIEEKTVILGEDRAGIQVPFRDKMRPMLAYFVLMMEALALASLIALEIQHRTLTALMVTPARLSDVLAAKSILGTTLAFSQALIMLAVTNSFGGEVAPLLLATLLGAIIVTGISLISGAAGKDFLGTLFYGIAFMIPLAIPAFSVLFPGSAAVWVKALPTWGVVETMVGSIAYGRTLGELSGPLGAAAGWCVAVFVVGLVILKRKAERL